MLLLLSFDESSVVRALVGVSSPAVGNRRNRKKKNVSFPQVGRVMVEYWIDLFPVACCCSALHVYENELCQSEDKCSI